MTQRTDPRARNMSLGIGDPRKWANSAGLDLGLPPDFSPNKQSTTPHPAVLDNVSQKGHGEEMVGDVPRVEQQPSVRAPPLRRGQGDLAVLHHLVHPVHAAHHAHRLCRVRLLHHLPQADITGRKALATLPTAICTARVHLHLPGWGGASCRPSPTPAQSLTDSLPTGGSPLTAREAASPRHSRRPSSPASGPPGPGNRARTPAFSCWQADTGCADLRKSVAGEKL